MIGTTNHGQNIFLLDPHKYDYLAQKEYFSLIFPFGIVVICMYCSLWNFHNDIITVAYCTAAASPM
jgi:hypothetical protein